MRTIAAVCAAATVLAVAPLTATAETGAMQPVGDVPVLAQTMIGNVTDARLAVLTVHGVRRIEGATILYYSLGLRPQDRSGASAYFGAYGNGNYTTLTQNGGSALPCAAAAIDVAGGTAYTSLRTGKSTQCISTSLVELRPASDRLGEAKVGYSVLAPVPGDVNVVDVFIGSQLLQNVPVEDGLMEPAVAELAPVVGTGWPTVDTAAISTAVEPEKAVFPLRSRVTNLEQKLSTAQGKEGKELEIDAAVLFAVDKATLTPRAAKVIAAVVRQIKDAGDKGSIVVTGHTDNTASDAYNQSLSTRRAQAVASALRAKLPSTIAIKAVGKGESEPIADNGTPEGKALNRRVTITLPTGE